MRCWKARFATLDEAEAALLKCRIERELRGRHRRRERRVYCCRRCAGFHLSSQPGVRERAA